MSGIELEARERLLQRRRVLRGGHADALDGEGTSWTDYEGALDPLPESARQELAEIDAALRRIAEGRFGTCLSCGGPMGLQRLRAIPEARFCLTCSGQESHRG